MQTYDKIFLAAGTQHFPGGFQFFLLESSADVTITIYGIQNKVLGVAKDVERGFNFKTKKQFLGVDVYSATAQTIKAWISHEAEGDFTPNPEITIPSAETFVGISDVTLTSSTAVLLLAANTARKKVLITADALNAFTVRIGDSGVTASKGSPIVGGQSIELETQDAIYAYATTSAQKVAISYTED